MDKVTTFEFLRYTMDLKESWNRLVEHSRNATFLHCRDFMDYHADRFADHSIVACKKGEPIALLPAHLTPDGTLHSHSGLTYGGWILPPRHFTGEEMLTLWQEFLPWLKEKGITAVDYKPLPTIYHASPSQEDIWALWRMGAEMTSCGLSSTIDLSLPLQFNQQQRRNLRRAQKCGCEVREMGIEEVPEFWDMLASCLQQRHDVKPVHSIEELSLLMQRFPKKIRLFCAEKEGVAGAAVCMFDTGLVAHAQYIATTPQGREDGQLSLLFHHLLQSVYSGKRFFDFGISTEDGGKVLNTGLHRQKSGFGATSVIYPRFTLTVR